MVCCVDPNDSLVLTRANWMFHILLTCRQKGNIPFSKPSPLQNGMLMLLYKYFKIPSHSNCF